MEALCNLLQLWLNPRSIINSLFKFPTINYYSSEYKTNLNQNETREGKIQLCNYLTSHSSITPRVRASLVNLMVEVHQKLRLSPETLYLTVSIFDRFLSKETVPMEEAKLVGMCAMHIASNYGVFDPLLELQELTVIWMLTYTIRDVLRMKNRILKRLELSLNVPTPHTYLFRYINIERTDHETECMIYFFSELALMQHSLIKMCPSLIAASCVHAARCRLKKYPLWTEALQGGTKYSEPQLLECTGILVEAHSQAPKSILNAVYEKYSLDKFKKVALHAPVSSTSRTAEPTRLLV
ncbi:hypothetical protein LUZ63_006110 [Rhynchospora breviuscula]|uniref:Uncharacterized protein n=1 Tax=Rhynchospora breviuscula TaxID=2022672 RepID=A0A9Q0CP53_9POAL|nr:hypothetical protein LUZ63_006110 [Rhynchospora breviuscula]